MHDDLSVECDSESRDFQAFYICEYQATVRLAGFLAGDRSEAEDLAQESFIRLQDAFVRLENPGGYLRTTLVNLCRNHHRRTGCEALRLVRHGATPTVVSDLSAAQLVDIVDGLTPTPVSQLPAPEAPTDTAVPDQLTDITPHRHGCARHHQRGNGASRTVVVRHARNRSRTRRALTPTSLAGELDDVERAPALGAKLRRVLVDESNVCCISATTFGATG